MTSFFLNQAAYELGMQDGIFCFCEDSLKIEAKPLEELLTHIGCQSVGVVGPKLLCRNGPVIKSTGYVPGMHGAVGHAHYGLV